MVRVALQEVEKCFAAGPVAAACLSLTVEDGQFLVLVGPSGCGKTTILRMIAGLEQPTRGTIRLGDRVVNHLAPRDRNVAMVFQQGALYPHLNVYGNIAFPLVLRRTPQGELDRRVREAASWLAIESLLERKPHTLSGGQSQRVALARAIVRRPACFLFDEPLSNLDFQLRLELRSLLKQLHQRLAATILYVTHDQEEALSLGQRLAVLRQGRLEQFGAPEEVFARPANRFVASFLGSPPMSFLEGTLQADDGRLGFHLASHRLAVPDWAHAALAHRAGQMVVLGVRAEAIRLEPASGATEPQAEPTLAGTIKGVELQGDRLTLELHIPSAGPACLLATVDRAGALPVGTRVQIRLIPQRLHFFAPDDPASGRPGASLCRGPVS